MNAMSVSFIGLCILTHLYGVFCGVTGHRVTQLLQLKQEGGGQEVGSDGHGLPELDEAWPQPGQQLPQLYRVLPLQSLVIPDLSPEILFVEVDIDMIWTALT